MSMWRWLTRGPSGRWSRRRYEQDLDDELRAHLEIEADERMDDGLSPAEAQAAARRQLGRPLLAIKDEARDAWGWDAWDRLWQDLRAAWRVLRRNPAFTLVAVLSLAIGIGANSAIFTLVDLVALRTLPVSEPDRLVRVVHAGERGSSGSANVALFRTLRDGARAFSGVTIVKGESYKIRHGDRLDTVAGQAVSGSYYATLGVDALIGRTLTGSDDANAAVDAKGSAEQAAVLGYAYWRRQFNGDPNVLGQTLVIDQHPYTIVGVTPPSFFGLQIGRTRDVTIPLPRPAEDDSRSWYSYDIIGRLAPGATAEQASAEVDAIGRPFLTQTSMPAKMREGQFQRLGVESAARGLGELRGEFAEPLVVLGGIVALVLLLACANLAGLLLARGVARQREMAVRAALGAGRWRLVRLQLAEGLVLATLGAIAGLGLAWFGTSALASFLPDYGAPRTLDLRPNPLVLAFTAAVTLVSGLLLGSASALRVWRTRLQPSLADGGRGATRTRLGAGRALVIFQVAVSLVLVTGALLLVRSLNNLKSVDTGFVRDGVLIFTFDRQGVSDDEAASARQARDLLARLRQLPGVTQAALARVLPLTGEGWQTFIGVPGFVAQDMADQVAHVNAIGGRFFETFRVPIVSGRPIRDEDDEAAPAVAVVSERFAKHFYGTANPIGHQLDVGRKPIRRVTIVGIAKDLRHQSIRKEAERTLYLSVAQMGPASGAWQRVGVAVRSTLPPSTLIPAARRTVHEMSPDADLRSMRMLTRELDERLVRERLLATLSGFFGIVALLLAAIGLYGLLAYAVSRRTGEIGIRLALGATRGAMLWMVCRECLLLAAAGTAIGLAGSFWTTRLLEGRLLEGFLFGLTPTDLTTLLLAVALLLGIALAAGLIPARRAARVDPLTALRHE
jgi:predicted permease